MIIKDGYNSKKTTIRIATNGNNAKDLRSAEVWIEQNGLSDKETLSYITLDELLNLKDEIQVAIDDIVK